jgi:hypothetical protein
MMAFMVEGRKQVAGPAGAAMTSHMTLWASSHVINLVGAITQRLTK